MHIFHNTDLEDCIRPQNNLEMDCSILNLKNDPWKNTVGCSTKAYWRRGTDENSNWMVPRRKFCSGRVNLLSFDQMEDLLLKQKEIIGNLSKEELEKLEENNETIKRFKDAGISFNRYQI